MFATTNWSEVFKWILLMPLFAIAGATSSLFFVYTLAGIFYLLEKIYKKIITPLCIKYPIISFVFDMTLSTLGKLFVWLILLTITDCCVSVFYVYYLSTAEINLILSVAVFVIYSFYHFYHKYKKYKIEPTTFLSNFMKDF
jgi:hypothetical protein